MSQQQPESLIKLPPHALDAEEATLGSFLIDPEAIGKVVSWLKPEDFYREKNQWTYAACLELNKRNEPTNQILVAHEMAQKQRLEAAGGAAYLSHLVNATPTSVHVEYYGKIVERLSFMRRLIGASNQIAAIGYESPPSIDDALGRVDEIINRLRNHPTKSSMATAAIDPTRVQRE